MATLNETINQVQNVFNDIESALQEQGVDTSNMKPVDYANAVRGIVNNITIENVSFLPVMIFCYSSTVPVKPVGGNWVQNEYTNQITPPDGWYLDLNNIEDASIGQDNIYMSVCIFKHDNTKYLDWTTPVRISGKDGKDGKTGKQGPAGNIAGVVIEYNTPLYAVTSANQAPDKPNCTYDVQNNSLSVNSEGWSLDTPDENSLGANILWQSIARYYSDKQAVVCSNPVRISAGNPDIFKENGFYTEYCITKEINGAKTEWFTPASADPPVPTLSSPFLWARDVMSTTVSGKHVGPVYLFATYSAGLIGIDVSYTCAPSRDALNALDESLWFNDSESALTPDATKEYHGLTEDTKYLWAREQFLYSNKEPDVQYRIVSTFTAAEKAAIVYSAGTFNEKVKYTRTEEQTPYVFFADGVTLDENNKYSNSGKKYYYFVLKYSYDDALYKIIPTNNTYPSIKDLYINSAASNKKCNWEKMESFDAIYSDIGVFKAANVGQFVFDDKYVFSQSGVDKTGAPRNYTEFSEWSVGTMNDGSSRKGIALAIETGEFIPNILLNAVDGSGKLAGGNVSWDSNGTTFFGDPNDGYMQVQNGKLKLTGSIEMGVNKDSLLEWGAFNEVKSSIDKSISDASFSEAKKQELAESLGYSDYDAFLNSENKIIKNGYINTGLINADAIVTDELISNKIAATTIAANSVKTTNASTTGSCELNGSTFNIISASGDKFIEMGEFEDSDFEQVKQSAKSDNQLYELTNGDTVTKFSVSNGKNSQSIIYPIMTCPVKTTLHIESLIVRLKYGTSQTNANLVMWQPPILNHFTSSGGTRMWNFVATNKPYLAKHDGFGYIKLSDQPEFTEIDDLYTSQATQYGAGMGFKNFDVPMEKGDTVFLIIPAGSININSSVINNPSYSIDHAHNYMSAPNRIYASNNGIMVQSGDSYLLADENKLQIIGNNVKNVKTVTSDYTCSIDDDILLCCASGITITPYATWDTGKQIELWCTSSNVKWGEYGVFINDQSYNGTNMEFHEGDKVTLIKTEARPKNPANKWFVHK